MVNDKNNCNHGSEYYLIKEQDFCPPSDDRCWTSNVRDIAGGDNFADFCEYFFEILDEAEYFES